MQKPYECCNNKKRRMFYRMKNYFIRVRYIYRFTCYYRTVLYVVEVSLEGSKYL